jgi:hypothetical protein
MLVILEKTLEQVCTQVRAVVHLDVTDPGPIMEFWAIVQ